MNDENPWINRYFDRIGLNDSLSPDLKNLRAIHRHHLLAIPFENLSVFLTGKISLDPEKVFEKIVTNRRGGWCFEQNGLYLRVLKYLGFETRTLMARSLTGPNRPRTHQIVLVKIDTEVWLSDIGFGGQPMRGPIRLIDGLVQTVEGQSYRLVMTPDNNPLPAFRSPDLWTLSTSINETWLESYEFTLESFSAADFLIANHFHVSASVSNFHEKWFATMPTAEGRLSLISNVLKQYELKSGIESLVSEGVMSSPVELGETLKRYFGLELNSIELEDLFALKRPPVHIDTGFGY